MGWERSNMYVYAMDSLACFVWSTKPCTGCIGFWENIETITCKAYIVRETQHRNPKNKVK